MVKPPTGLPHSEFPTGVGNKSPPHVSLVLASQLPFSGSKLVHSSSLFPFFPPPLLFPGFCFQHCSLTSRVLPSFLNEQTSLLGFLVLGGKRVLTTTEGLLNWPITNLILEEFGESLQYKCLPCKAIVLQHNPIVTVRSEVHPFFFSLLLLQGILIFP